MKIYMLSLGCDKNRVDSEKMLSGMLDRYEGAELTDDPSEADLAVVNTCAFIGPAKEESINAIIEVGQYKKTGHLKKLIVTGCLVERYKAEMKKELPEIDEIEAVSEYVDKLDQQLRRIDSGFGFTRYLKIAEGCNKRCAYCVIPDLRGPFRSVPMETVLKEAEELAESGAKEIILVAQETTLYGTDLYGRKALPTLLSKLSEIDGIQWIRIFYCYPEEITDELVREIRDNPKICHYLDIPIQHASDRILQRMRRRTRESELRGKIALLRQEIPDICLRTTLISGFPGETEEDFEILRRFVQEERFDRLGVFPYSREEGTPAAEMPDQVPERIKKKRADELMKLQQQIAFQRAKEQIGRVLPVLIEGYDPERRSYAARSYMDAPDIDSLVYVSSEDSGLISGSMLNVQITGTDGYDLLARKIEEGK